MTDAERRSILDLPPDIDAEAAGDAEADAEIEAGLGVPHEPVREWLLRLGQASGFRHRLPDSSRSSGRRVR